MWLSVIPLSFDRMEDLRLISMEVGSLLLSVLYHRMDELWVRVFSKL